MTVSHSDAELVKRLDYLKECLRTLNGPHLQVDRASLADIIADFDALLNGNRLAVAAYNKQADRLESLLAEVGSLNETVKAQMDVADRLDKINDDQVRRSRAREKELETQVSRLSQPTRDRPEDFVWLIEWPEDDTVPVRWWHPVSGWMRDANKAARFSRREDAQAYITASRGGLGNSTIKPMQHKFCSNEWRLSQPTRDGWQLRNLLREAADALSFYASSGRRILKNMDDEGYDPFMGYGLSVHHKQHHVVKAAEVHDKITAMLAAAPSPVQSAENEGTR